MISRIITLPKDHSFFLFGARLTGKSTLLRHTFPEKETLYLDLLQSREYLRLAGNPALFREDVLGREQNIRYVIVDEIQRLPALLNEVHSLMEGKSPPVFILSGSSARKLKRGGANLLAGRAWTFQLFPLTHRELGNNFQLKKSLEMGTLPSIYLSKPIEAKRTLSAYVETYLKEEIRAEAVLRRTEAFMRFLPLAGEWNGQNLNYSNLSRETGVSYHTIREYFQILEDTLLGFFLPAFTGSIGKRLVRHPRFFFFDPGVCRALTGRVGNTIPPKSSEFGQSFEHFIVLEVLRLSRYAEKECRLSYYREVQGVEVDLIVEVPGKQIFAVECKATDRVHPSMLSGLRAFGRRYPKARLICACREPRKRKSEGVEVVPWEQLFKIIGI